MRSGDKTLTRDALARLRERITEEKRLQTGRFTARITVHAGTCGLASGAQSVHDTMLEELARSKRTDIEITTSGCIGLCSAEPLLTVETIDLDPVVYSRVDAASATEIFHGHLIQGEVAWDHALMWGFPVNEEPKPEGSPLDGKLPHVSELPFFALQRSWVLRNRGRIDPESMEDALGRGGYAGLERALFELSPRGVIDDIKTSGLRGRGGGGFPTGIKWEFCANAREKQKYVLCNADEGDPGAFMDRSVMESDPHAVLEGMIIAARAIGATEGFIYCRAEYPLAVHRLKLAIAQAHEYGLLGDDILGSGVRMDIQVYLGAGAFVCGEETALIRSLEGRRGTPRPRPPFPAVQGLWQKPTVLNNVETYANVGLILERGAEAYAQVGTESSKGTKVFALTGKVRNVGLVEVDMGTPLGQIVFDIGGGIPDDRQFKAVQIGGPSGGCLPSEHLNTPTEYEALTRAGAIMGSGGMIVLDEETCMVDIARYFMDFCQDESCGRCTPCRVGTRRLLQILERICNGQGTMEDLALIEDLAPAIKDAALCGLGQTAPNPVLCALRYFRHEFEDHILRHHCDATVCAGLVTSPCQHACPVGMDVPAYVALVRAQRLEDAYRVLLQTNPLPSVCGRVCPHPCQSRCRRGQLDEPLAIRHIKRHICDSVERPAMPVATHNHPDRVAIIGAGPAGLMAASELCGGSYGVTLFEQLPEPGGMMRYGIPAYRLPRDILSADIESILSGGVELRAGVTVGKDIELAEILDKFQAVFLAVGAQRSLSMGLPGEADPGVIGAVEFLRDVHSGAEIEIGRRVAVIGGGNAAIDAARTALRVGAQEVTVYYRREAQHLPAYREEIEGAQQEGISIEPLLVPVRLLRRGDLLTGLELAPVELTSFDLSARRRPVPLPDKSFERDADTVIVAIGQAPDLSVVEGITEIETTSSRVLAASMGGTGHPRVWAGGDIVTGAATVIEAIRAGRDAARDIDRTLRAIAGEPPSLPLPVEPIDIPREVDEDPEIRPQEKAPMLDPISRRGNFEEVELGYVRETATAEARRCLRCDLGAVEHPGI